MIEISFRDFYDYRYSKEEFHELYIMKNGLNQVLYVGISNQNIWNRWFGWNGHVMGDEKYMTGQSTVGQKIVDYLPESWNWKIQLWTLENCIEFCKDDPLFFPKSPRIEDLEPIMIQLTRPILNVSYNQNPSVDLMPQSLREKKRKEMLDKIYKDVFEKRGAEKMDKKKPLT